MLGLWAALASLLSVALPVLLLWAADGRSGATGGQAARIAGTVWLAASGTPLSVPGGRFGLAPLGLAVLPLAVLARAGRLAVRDRPVPDLRSALRRALALAAPSAVVAGVVAVACAGDGVAASPLLAVPCVGLVALLGAAVGVVRGAELADAVLDRVPGALRRLLRPVAVAVTALLGVSALLVAGALLLEVGTAADLARVGDPGAAGGLGSLALGLAYAPVAVAWAASWLAGPGSALGTGTAVAPFGVDLGPVPALPLLAALPDGTPPLWGALLGLLVPVGAGLLAGRLLLRRDSARPVLEALAVGPAAGLVLAVVAWLSSGPLGGGRLAEVGPSAWRVGLAVAVEVSVGALLAVRLLPRRG